ncbi:MAG TPA: ATP-binding protein [Tepidiformaceae bacterium]|nr:ATP-binding protein [Tepidiformaceae bacterium]
MKAPAALPRPGTGLAVTAVAFAALTATLAPLVHDALLPVALCYLLVALVSAAVWGWVVGIVAAVAANLLFNFFFVDPLHRFTVNRPDDVAGLAMFLAVAAIGAGMLSLLRRQLAIAQDARAEAKMLLAVSREVAKGVSPRDALDRLCGSITDALGVSSCSILREADGWQVIGTSAGINSVSRQEENLASQAAASGDIVFYERGGGARRGGPSPSSARVSFVPVLKGPGAPAVIRLGGALQPSSGIPAAHLLDAFRDEVSVAVNRAVLQDEMRRFDRLKQADELKSALLSSVSHDLRTPLTAIKAAVGNLRDPDAEWSDDDRQLFLETLQGQVERLSTTVEGLLEMTRLEGGAVQPRLEFIQVAPLLEEVLQASGPALADRCVSLVSADSLWVRADYRLAFQAMQNIVENAAKHTAAGGRISVGAERSANTVRLWVEDDGPGIPPSELPHIFEKFYRGGTEGSLPGAGLGLSIAKAMVELNGGSVRAEPRDGGTRFVIELPAAPAPR